MLIFFTLLIYNTFVISIAVPDNINHNYRKFHLFGFNVHPTVSKAFCVIVFWLPLSEKYYSWKIFQHIRCTDSVNHQNDIICIFEHIYCIFTLRHSGGFFHFICCQVYGKYCDEWWVLINLNCKLVFDNGLWTKVTTQIRTIGFTTQRFCFDDQA